MGSLQAMRSSQAMGSPDRRRACGSLGCAVVGGHDVEASHGVVAGHEVAAVMPPSEATGSTQTMSSSQAIKLLQACGRRRPGGPHTDHEVVAGHEVAARHAIVGGLPRAMESPQAIGPLQMMRSAHAMGGGCGR